MPSYRVLAGGAGVFADEGCAPKPDAPNAQHARGQPAEVGTQRDPFHNAARPVRVREQVETVLLFRILDRVACRRVGKFIEVPDQPRVFALQLIDIGSQNRSIGDGETEPGPLFEIERFFHTHEILRRPRRLTPNSFALKMDGAHRRGGV